MYTILSKSEGVPFQISFFLGDLRFNDPIGSCKFLPLTTFLQINLGVRFLTDLLTRFC